MCLKDIVLLLLLIHFLDIDLHQLVWFDCFASVDFTLRLGRGASFCRVQDLIVELDLVFQSLTTSIKQLDSLFFIAID